MDGFVTDYISTFTGETCRQLTHGEYAHLMIGCTPGAAPGAQGHRPGLRGLRRLVLRGTVPDLHEPGTWRNPKCGELVDAPAPLVVAGIRCE